MFCRGGLLAPTHPFIFRGFTRRSIGHFFRFLCIIGIMFNLAILRAGRHLERVPISRPDGDLGLGGSWLESGKGLGACLDHQTVFTCKSWSRYVRNLIAQHRICCKESGRRSGSLGFLAMARMKGMFIASKLRATTTCLFVHCQFLSFAVSFEASSVSWSHKTTTLR